MNLYINVIHLELCNNGFTFEASILGDFLEWLFMVKVVYILSRQAVLAPLVTPIMFLYLQTGYKSNYHTIMARTVLVMCMI